MSAVVPVPVYVTDRVQDPVNMLVDECIGLTLIQEVSWETKTYEEQQVAMGSWPQNSFRKFLRRNSMASSRFSI